MNNPIGVLKHAWNLFSYDNETKHKPFDNGYGQSVSPTRPRFSRGNERTVVTSVYNRLSLDASAIDIKHVQLDESNRYEKDMDSSINKCLTIRSNIDQTSRAFIQDLVVSLLDEGCVAVVPVDTSVNPENGKYDIESLRVGRITQWYPTSVRVLLYNEETGMKQEVTVPKNRTAIIENPFYAVMNEPNSTMQRLIRKLALMDSVDEESSSGKLDLIIQLPYVIKTEAKREQAEARRIQIEEQLKGSKYGVAYIDGTEHVTQLNRSLENNLMKQIEYLTEQLLSQLGITQGVLDGTADENTMNNYYNRVVEPILAAIVDEFHSKFLTDSAMKAREAILFFRDPFKLIPVNEVSEIADKFTRNEIMSSNEVRQIIGMKPSKDPSADELRNKNLSQSKMARNIQTEEPKKEEDNKNE